MESDQRNSASWIDDGEKYAVIALRVKLDDPVPLQEMAAHHSAFADARFDMPAHDGALSRAVPRHEKRTKIELAMPYMPSNAPERNA